MCEWTCLSTQRAPAGCHCVHVIHKAPPFRSKSSTVRRPLSAHVRHGGLSPLMVLARSSTLGAVRAPFTPIRTSILRRQSRCCLRGSTIHLIQVSSVGQFLEETSPYLWASTGI